MDKMKDNLLEYKRTYDAFVLSLQDLNAVHLNEPYRSIVADLGKELAQHKLIINAMLGLEQPEVFYMATFSRQMQNVSGSAYFKEKSLGAPIPVSPAMQHLIVNDDYIGEEDDDE